MDPRRSTGQVGRLLSTTEPKLNHIIRRGLIHPGPPVVAGRRLWSRDHILQAAAALGRLTDDLRAQLAEEVPA